MHSVVNYGANHADSSADQESYRRKNEELLQALREKNKKFLHTQELYDKLKRRAMLGQVQDAALDAVDYNIQQASVVSKRYTEHHGKLDQRPRQSPMFSTIENSYASPSHVGQPSTQSMQPPKLNRPPAGTGERNGFPRGRDRFFRQFDRVTML